MTRVTVSQSQVTLDWLPLLFEAASLVSVAAGEIRFLNAAGQEVALTGRGFRLSEDGQPLGGRVTGAAVLGQDGRPALSLAGLGADLAVVWRFAFGISGPDGAATAPDGAALLAHLLRGNDRVTGSDGDDVLLAGGGAGTGADRIFGGAGDDYLRGDAGSDQLYGGSGHDTLSYDLSFFDAFAFRGIVLDVAAGTATDPWGGQDRFAGFDSYRDSAFADLMTGTAAAETWHLGAGADTLDGGGGGDWLDYAASAALGGTRGIQADLALGRVRDPWGHLDLVTGVSALGGTFRDDVLRGDGGTNSFDGRQGADRFDGRGGYDRIGFWDVARLGGQGVVIDMARRSGQILDDGFGNRETARSIEAFSLSDLDDSFAGSDQSDNVGGGAGDDTLHGRAGDDDLRGEAGDDLLSGGNDRNRLDGGEGRDTLSGGNRDDDFLFRHLGEADADRVLGFDPAQDEIWIAITWGGLDPGRLSSSAFRSGAGATEAISETQRVIYDTSTGILRFDRDGAGGEAAQVFAVIDNRSALSAADFGILD